MAEFSLTVYSMKVLQRKSQVNFHPVCTWCKFSSLKVSVNFHHWHTGKKFYSNIQWRSKSLVIQHCRHVRKCTHMHPHTHAHTHTHITHCIYMPTCEENLKTNGVLNRCTVLHCVKFEELHCFYLSSNETLKLGYRHLNVRTETLLFILQRLKYLWLVRIKIPTH